MDHYPTLYESKKYSLLYAKHYRAGPTKRTLKWGIPRMILGDIKIIDLGCGRGTARDMFKKYKEYVGVDIAGQHIIEMQKEAGPNDTFIMGNICDLPFEDNYFDVGVCVDVLEHIPPEFIEQAVKEILRVCKNLIVSISTIPSKNLDFEGKNLHLCQKPVKWWRDLFSSHITITQETVLGIGNISFIMGPDTQAETLGAGFLEHAKMGRLLHDGTFFLPRHNIKLEALFDKLYERQRGELRWAPKIEYKYSLSTLSETDQPVIIVGKGPSLDHLNKSYFADYPKAPVLCINEAIRKVEALDIENPVYLVQHDKIDCKPRKESTVCILDKDAQYKYPEITEKYVYSKHGLELSITLTVLAAVRVAVRYMRTNQLFMLCFDACTNGDTGYADIVGYDVKSLSDGTGGERFLKHRDLIVNHSEGVKITWVTPAPDGSNSYILQLLRDNLAEHHVPSPEECSSVSPASLDLPS